MPVAIGAADIDQYEQQAHGDGADGEQLAVDYDFANGLPVIDVCRDYQDHRGRRHADQERKIADVETPAHLVAHGSETQARLHLPEVRQGARDDKKAEEC